MLLYIGFQVYRKVAPAMIALVECQQTVRPARENTIGYQARLAR